MQYQLALAMTDEPNAIYITADLVHPDPGYLLCHLKVQEGVDGAKAILKT